MDARRQRMTAYAAVLRAQTQASVGTQRHGANVNHVDTGNA